MSFNIFGFMVLIAFVLIFIFGSKTEKKVVLSISALLVIGILMILGEIILLDFLGSGATPLIWIDGIGLYVLLLSLIWAKSYPKWLKRSFLGVFVLGFVYSSVVGAQYLYKASFAEVPSEDEVNLSAYLPFGSSTLAKSLEAPSNLKFISDVPLLDGATALYPLYASFVRATYPEKTYYVYNEFGRNSTSSEVVCSRTSGAFSNLIDRKADVIFLMGVSEDMSRQAKEAGVSLKLTPIGREAFVFMVNEKNSVTDLSLEQIRQIYSGEVTDWSQIGKGSGEIAAYQRPEESGSQIQLKEVMGDIPIKKPVEKEVYSMMMGLYMEVANYKNYESAIGYSFSYYIRDMASRNEAKKVRLLSINGVEPTNENIANGTYPFSQDFYAVSIEKKEGMTEVDRNTEKFIEWILSEQGQELVEKVGYVKLPAASER
jgi:phosphate transport system substrate-binding protein